MAAARPARRAQPAQRPDRPRLPARSGRAAGAATTTALRAAAAGFVPLASRLQVIGTVGGVTFVDDSLSTNVLPTLAAMDAFPGRRDRADRRRPRPRHRLRPARRRARRPRRRHPGAGRARQRAADPGRDRGGTARARSEVAACAGPGGGGRAAATLGAAGRGGAALAGRAELRPLPRLPGPGRGVRPRHARLPGLTAAASGALSRHRAHYHAQTLWHGGRSHEERKSRPPGPGAAALPVAGRCGVTPPGLPASLLREFATVVGGAHVLTGDAAVGYATDWTGRIHRPCPGRAAPARHRGGRGPARAVRGRRGGGRPAGRQHRPGRRRRPAARRGGAQHGPAGPARPGGHRRRAGQRRGRGEPAAGRRRRSPSGSGRPHRQPAQRHRGRGGRHQRGRSAGAAAWPDAGPATRHRGGAFRRHRPVAHVRAGQGQHRL